MKCPLPTRERHQPLHEAQPKPNLEDPSALTKIEAIAESPCYREADRDPDFMNRGDMRGVRLMLDYQKPQTLLVEHDVAHIIVVFGSTRIPEPAAARRNCETLAAALEARPADPAVNRRLEIARRVLVRRIGDRYLARYPRLVRNEGRPTAAAGLDRGNLRSGRAS
jgi:hypothetical protein